MMEPQTHTLYSGHVWLSSPKIPSSDDAFNVVHEGFAQLDLSGQVLFAARWGVLRQGPDNLPLL